MKRFEAVAEILQLIWFAKEYVDYDNKAVDWGSIELNMEKISPSTTEKEMMVFARNLWNGDGVFALSLARLDKIHQLAVLKSLHFALDIPWEL